MDVINGYRVIKNLGEGSFGTTYQVEKDGQDFALKLIRENILHRDITANRRVEREIRILKAVDNPYVVKYYNDGFYNDGNQKYRYIVMEYAEGITLEKFINANKKNFSSRCTFNNKKDFSRYTCHPSTKCNS
ncbi:hypothetical protein HMSSN036_87060 [Paenibacillus macerans]|nr:hypothetical protein HMSSN036_87060 [Paenibacillus macerans]